MVEVKVYYRCNTLVHWIQCIKDPHLVAELNGELSRRGYSTVAFGAVQETTDDVHMSAAPIAVMDEKEGQKTAADPEAAQSQGALPPPSTRTLSCVVGKDYIKKNKLDKSGAWFWFSATCGLVMSALSSWELRTKEAGVHASGGYVCRHCKGKWQAGKPGSRMLDFFDGKFRLQVILDEPCIHLWNRWARDRHELYKRLEPNAPPRDEAPATDIPARHRIQVNSMVSEAIWQVVLGNHEKPGLEWVSNVARNMVTSQ
jgi:hypothetical protein